MEGDNSDIEDPGRRDSETQLRKTKMNSKYLDDVIAKTGMDYDEAVERIEREQRAKETMDSEYLNSFNEAFRCDNPKGDDRERFLMEKHLIGTYDTSVKASERALGAVDSRGKNDYTLFHGTGADYKKNIKETLFAGRRVLRAGLDPDDSVESPKLVSKKEERAAKRAKCAARRGDTEPAVFTMDEDKDQTLKYAQKGVKKMTKGLGSQ